MKVELNIFRQDEQGFTMPGALVYRNHELMRVEGRGRRGKDGGFKVRFRRIGKVNLDRQFRDAEVREFKSLSSGYAAEARPGE